MKIALMFISAVLLPGAIAAVQKISPPSPFACNRSALSSTARKRHFDELGPILAGKVRSVRALSDGYEFQFPVDPATFRLVAEWVADERLCCPFFEIDLRLERENGAFWLRLSGRPGVKQFIEADFDKWMNR